jgi:8-oxo-dGTP pyrophosphatase MutT (NUDIX family)
LKTPPAILENLFRFADGEPRSPNVRPKDAATLIVYRRDAGGIIRILMGERSGRHAFLPGRYVFPGGRLEPADRRLTLATDLRPHVLARAASGSTPAKARGLALAAIRETFEETGLLLGAPSAAAPRTRSPAWRDFFGHNVTPRLEALDFIARAITPPGRPRRFDARFFMAGAEEIAADAGAEKASGELLRSQWLTLDEARSAKVIPITLCIIDEIEARLGDGADPRRPVPFFIPQRGKAVIEQL